MPSVKLLPPSSGLKRSMTINTDHVSEHANFWMDNTQGKDRVWQVCADKYSSLNFK